MLKNKFLIASIIGIIVVVAIFYFWPKSVKASAPADPAKIEAIKFWSDLNGKKIQKESKECYSITTRLIKFEKEILEKPFVSEKQLQHDYRVLLYVKQLQPICEGKYDHLTELSSSEIFEKEMADSAKLSPEERKKQDDLYIQAKAEQEPYLNVMPSNTIADTQYLSEAIECSFPERSQVNNLAFSRQGISPEMILEKIMSPIEDAKDIDNSTTQVFLLRQPMTFFGMTVKNVYRHRYDDFLGVQIASEQDIPALAKKLNLSKRPLNAAETADSRAIIAGLGVEHPEVESLYVYSRPVNNGFGEIRLTHVYTNNLMYQPTPASSADIWYLGCMLKMPEIKEDIRRSSRITNSLKNSISFLDNYLKNKD